MDMECILDHQKIKKIIIYSHCWFLCMWDSFWWCSIISGGRTIRRVRLPAVWFSIIARAKYLIEADKLNTIQAFPIQWKKGSIVLLGSFFQDKLTLQYPVSTRPESVCCSKSCIKVCFMWETRRRRLSPLLHLLFCIKSMELASFSYLFHNIPSMFQLHTFGPLRLREGMHLPGNGQLWSSIISSLQFGIVEIRQYTMISLSLWAGPTNAYVNTFQIPHCLSRMMLRGRLLIIVDFFWESRLF